VQWPAHRFVIGHNRFRPFAFHQMIPHTEPYRRQLNVSGSFEREHEAAAQHLA
jgi:hypothetical protein